MIRGRRVILDIDGVVRQFFPRLLPGVIPTWAIGSIQNLSLNDWGLAVCTNQPVPKTTSKLYPGHQISGLIQQSFKVSTFPRYFVERDIPIFASPWFPEIYKHTKNAVWEVGQWAAKSARHKLVFIGDQGSDRIFFEKVESYIEATYQNLNLDYLFIRIV